MRSPATLLLASLLAVWASCTPLKRDSSLAGGSGSFQIGLGRDKASRSIEVSYYRPKGFSSKTRFVLVIPGAGRNAADYRDSWIASAEAYNLMILAPRYPESEYPFAQYHLGGIVSGLQLDNPQVEKRNGRIAKYRIADENIRFSKANPASAFLFNDFDRIFEKARIATGSTATHYDLFGHSAGGQILHRHALFARRSKARHIVAANSGFYTLPNKGTRFPFGLMGSDMENGDLKERFARRLVVLLGEKDDRNEMRGTLLHTPTIDRRGLSRVERGRHFFESGEMQAKKLGAAFEWKLRVVTGVGHDYRKMGEAAARHLYAQPGEPRPGARP